MATKSNTTKYLLIAGVAAVGYYFYTRSSSAAVTASPVDNATMAVLSSWAGSAGASAPLYMSFVNSLNPAEAAFVLDLVTNYWNKGIAPSLAQSGSWVALKMKYGLD